MSSRTLTMTDRLHAYLLSEVGREAPILAELRRETQPMAMGGMQISPEHGQFVALLIETLGVRRYLEIGTFTGYSALVAALAMPADGRAVCLDRSEEWTAIARRYWKKAGVADKIDLRLGDGRPSLDALLAAGAADTFDMAFIDADKTGYDAYYERCLDLVRPGGLILLDNMLWSGAVADPAATDEDTMALKALNRKIRDDQRVTCSMVPIGDGVMLCRKR
jgi:predicted O-methyltransferase YrrM